MTKQIRNDEALRKIALKFKSLREQAGKLQKEVENETGVNIGSVEVAQFNFSIKTIERLCCYYGISLDSFFEDLDL